MSDIGHNNPPPSIAVHELAKIVSEIEALETSRAEVAEDIKLTYAKAKGAGFDVKTLRRTIALRKMKRGDRHDQAALLQLYCEALGVDDIFL